MASPVGEEAVRCQHFGVRIGTRINLHQEPCGVYACAHPRIRETTVARCRQCRHFTSLDGAPAPTPQIALPTPQIASAIPQDIADSIVYQIPTSNPPLIPDAANLRLTSLAQRLAKAKAPPDQLPGLIVDRWNRPAGMANLFYDAGVFLILSGPSLRSHQLDRLNQRGIVTMAVNNAATVVRPTLWTHVDPPIKFHQAIWLDPGVLKFLSVRRFNKDRLRLKDEDGVFRTVDHLYNHFPSVFGYVRNANFNPATYLTEASANWGNSKKSAAANGYPHVLNVMFCVLRLLYYLGFRRVYLLGCDFRMTEGVDAYAFPQDKPEGATGSNNFAYLKLNHMLATLKPHFDKAGYQVYNCHKESGLVVFPYLAFGEAIRWETALIPTVLDTLGWYEKN